MVSVLLQFRYSLLYQKTSIFRKCNYPYPWIFFFCQFSAPIYGTIVHKYHINSEKSLSFQTVQTTFYILHPIKIRNHNSYLLHGISFLRTQRIIPFAQRKVFIIIRISCFNKSIHRISHKFYLLLEPAHFVFTVLRSLDLDS